MTITDGMDTVPAKVKSHREYTHNCDKSHEGRMGPFENKLVFEDNKLVKQDTREHFGGWRAEPGTIAKIVFFMYPQVVSL